MKVEEFSQRVKAARQRLILLQSHSGQLPPLQEGLLAAAFTELRLAVEALQVAEAELRQQNQALASAHQQADLERQHYQGLFELAPVSYLVTDMAGNITQVNRAATMLLQARPPFLVGKPLTTFVAQAEQAEFERRRWCLCQSQKYPQAVPQEWELYLYPQNGKPFKATLTVAVIWDWQGQAQGLSWLVRDLTERRQQEEALVEAKLAQAHWLDAIALRIRQSLKLDTILQTTVKEIRTLLQVERVAIYQFEPSHRFVAESRAAGFPSALGSEGGTGFDQDALQRYQQGLICAINDIYQADFSSGQLAELAQLQIRANLVMPIWVDQKLWGLLCAHQCSAPRPWTPSELALLSQLLDQTAIAIQQATLYEQLQSANQALERLATLDSLTQLANRRYFDEYLSREWQRLARERAPLTLILADIDYFKAYNDTYGHQAGDSCLKQVAQAIRRAVQRPMDLVSRYGGEEFAVILPNTEPEGGLQVAANIRAAVGVLKIPHTRSRVSEFLTFSLGVASTLPNPQSSSEALIAAADQALYQAKAKGRDRIQPALTSEGISA